MRSKYLGNSLRQGTIRKVSWQDLLNRIKARLASWTLKPLNLPSRLVLVKSVLQAMPVYIFSILLAPKSILREIQSIQRNFLWEGRESKAKFVLLSWEQVCRCKEIGGLGLRDPKIMGKIQGAKIWWWWCKYTQELWAKIWYIKYVRDRPKS